MRYRVYVNDKEQLVWENRVSKIPFNRVFAGRQRSLDQTEIAYYSDFDIQEKSILKIVVEEVEISRVEIRPLVLNRQLIQEKNTLTMHISPNEKFTIEINGYHNALYVFANEPYVYTPREGDLYFPAGEHHIGCFFPKSNTRIVLDRDAVVYGTLYLENVENIIIEGRGVLNAAPFKRPLDTTLTDEVSCQVVNTYQQRKFDRDRMEYSGLLTAYHSKNVKIDGIILQDSFFWTLILRNGCENVEINNIKILGQWRYNSDGVDICNSYHVTLKNSFIRTFDDCIIVRAPLLKGEEGGCRDIVAENNILWCDWGKNLEVWFGNISSTIQDVFFKDNYCIHVAITAISIDTWYGAENILAENIVYENIFVEYDEQHLTYQYQQSDEDKYDDSKIEDDEMLLRIAVSFIGIRLGGDQARADYEVEPDFHSEYRNIHLHNVVEIGKNASIVLYGQDKMVLDNITLNGKRIDEK